MALIKVSNYACKHFGQENEHLKRMINYTYISFLTRILFVVILTKYKKRKLVGQKGLTLRANFNINSGTRRLRGGAVACLAKASASPA